LTTGAGCSGPFGFNGGINFGVYIIPNLDISICAYFCTIRIVSRKYLSGWTTLIYPNRGLAINGTTIKPFHHLGTTAIGSPIIHASGTIPGHICIKAAN
jgi:hypothetical protein